MKKLFIISMLLTTAFSCEESEFNERRFNSSHRVKILGKKLENPYSVKNMTKAWEKLKEKGRIKGDELEITTTHYYVRHLPENEESLSQLKSDTTVTFYDFPLDYEIVQEGDYFHDPTIPEEKPTFQYVSIPAGKEILTDIQSEIIENLFIPDEYKDDSSEERIANEEIIEDLVDEAFRITGNSENQVSDNLKTNSSKWRPAGTIRVFDDTFGYNYYRPVQGVEVKARRWFTTHKGITNELGYYSCDGRFKRDANYSLEWDRHHFALREGWLDKANIDGPKKKGNWDLDLSGGVSAFHAKVFMAAYHYYYKEIKGLRRPPQNGTLNTKLRIRCYDEKNEEINGNHKEERRFLGLGSQIKIYNPQNRMSDIYATTIHEIAHASHWNMWKDGDLFDNTDKIVKESWASGVEWELTRMIWPNYTIFYGRKKGGSSDPIFNYTGVVQDMIDGIGVNDQVEGYNIRQIEDALRGNKIWNNWRNNIKNNNNNGTENNLDALFDYWN
jgi:hypothetical protein